MFTTMKKIYMIPRTAMTLLSAREQLLDGSAKITGNAEVEYGGHSEGGMSSDVKGSGYNVWNDDWSN